MNTFKILAGWALVICLIVFLVALAFGIDVVFAAYRSVFILLAAIHVVCAHALFTETRKRRQDGNNTFLNLDPIFWAMVGLAFGVLALLLYRLLNDQFQERNAQRDDARNGGNAPEDERSP